MNSPYRFDLEKALASWRRTLTYNRAFTTEDLDELERHVRDQVAALRAQGLIEKEAFRRALREMGSYGEAEAEYRKVYWGKLKRQHRLKDELLWRLTMWKNYGTIALRNLRKQKGYTFINLSGLAIGLACSMLILLWVQDELSYDRFHEQGDQLYRVMVNNDLSDDQTVTWHTVPKPLAETLEAQYPEITHTVLMKGRQELLFAREDQVFREQGYFAGPAFFEIFSFPFLSGDPHTALDAPRNVVISERLARKYFGSVRQAGSSVLGQTIRIENQEEFTVTGVFEDIPQNSSLQFDYVLPIETLVQGNDGFESWGYSAFLLYVRLQEGADLARINDKIKNVINDQFEGDPTTTTFLHHFGTMYLYSDFKDGQLVVGGRIAYVRLFGFIALFLLLIASINFMNLTTARSAQRAREIGVRKAVGASKGTLMGQFLAESMLLTLLAFVLALGLVLLTLPVFNTLTGKGLTLDYLDLNILLVFLGIALGTGLVAGSYPALYLSSFNVIGVLRNTVNHHLGGVNLRKGLVVFQFAVSTLLILGTMTVSQQIDYMLTKDLGLDEENLLFMRLEGGLREQYDTFKQELLQQPGIADVTASSTNPLRVVNQTVAISWAGKDPESTNRFHYVNAHFDFAETMRMELVAGRDFSEDFSAGSVSFLINERAAEVMGLENPVGEQLLFWEKEGEIVGVVKDFHMTSLHAVIEPTIIRLSPNLPQMLFVRTEAGQTAEAIAGLEAVHKAFSPGYPFDFQFLDEKNAASYRSEIVVGKLSNYFAFLAILIAGLGLFGLAAFTAQQRTKEIGVRKVLGATVSNLVVLLSKDFIVLVLTAFVVTIPLSYFVMERWLNNFAYRIEIGAGIFVLTGALVVLMALLTVSYQAVKAALADPVKSLRYE